jgi:hypothetical protein
VLVRCTNGQVDGATPVALPGRAPVAAGRVLVGMHRLLLRAAHHLALRVRRSDIRPGARRGVHRDTASPPCGHTGTRNVRAVQVLGQASIVTNERALHHG